MSANRYENEGVGMVVRGRIYILWNGGIIIVEFEGITTTPVSNFCCSVIPCPALP